MEWYFSNRWWRAWSGISVWALWVYIRMPPVTEVVLRLYYPWCALVLIAALTMALDVIDVALKARDKKGFQWPLTDVVLCSTHLMMVGVNRIC